ncbi:MAG: NUDIX domain-containing protein [Bacteroidetes bacterium]|nr:NUDIX domain-containing protein [Bacteroidota bacterium]
MPHHRHSTQITAFNIRVYGILINKRNEVLLSDEYEFGMKFTKFPGGGLKLGEGAIDCLKRECIEELGQEIEIIGHYYTTDFFQPSAFHADRQIISIYYRIRLASPARFRVSVKKFDFKNLREGAQSLRWVKIDKNLPDEVTFPIDKIVAKMIRKKYR